MRRDVLHLLALGLLANFVAWGTGCAGYAPRAESFSVYVEGGRSWNRDRGTGSEFGDFHSRGSGRDVRAGVTVNFDLTGAYEPEEDE